MKLQAGDFVRVKAKEEILRSLDREGRLEGLPFMPQMFQYCGQVFRVYKRAHKTCDTVNRTGGRALPNTVHLDLRCDGHAYGGCEAGCLIFWKDAWLERVNPTNVGVPLPRTPLTQPEAQDVAYCTEKDVWAATRVGDSSPGETRYSCQATQLPYFTKPLAWWDVRQYVEDYASKNASLSRLLVGFVYVLYYNGTQAWRNKIGRPGRWLYDTWQGVWGGVPFPRRRGMVPDSEVPPSLKLGLQPGELVRIKTHREILATIHAGGLNRGLLFDAEMVPYCGGVYKVKRSVGQFINEQTGKMCTLKTPAVILDDVWCESRYTDCRMFCPRSIYSWWREVWLERVPGTAKNDVRGKSESGTSGEPPGSRARTPPSPLDQGIENASRHTH